MATATIMLPVQAAKVSGDFITTAAQIDGGQGTWKLLFDDSQTEEALWQFRVPTNYSSTPVAKIEYAMAGANTSQKIDMEIKVMSVANGEDIDSASFDTLNEVTGGTTCPDTAGHMDSISLSLANNDSMAAGELCIIHIQRDHDDADDTATGDVELIALSIDYTTS